MQVSIEVLVVEITGDVGILWLELPFSLTMLHSGVGGGVKGYRFDGKVV